MASCPHCHIYQGLWSPLAQNKQGEYVCKINPAHHYTRDKDGNFHSVQPSR